MNLGRAFTYVANDPDGIGKVVVVVALTAVTIITLPIFGLGLAPLSVLLGYTLKIINNVRDKKKIILPEWDDFSDYLAQGSRVVPALIFYNLPFIVFGSCVIFVPGTFPDDAVDGLATLSTVCCIIPLTFLYLGISWPLLAVGMARYARGAPVDQFFQVGRLFELSSEIRSYSIQWVLMALGVFLLFLLLMLIPCVGWLIGLGLVIPVQAHLAGQYALKLDEHQKRKNDALRA